MNCKVQYDDEASCYDKSRFSSKLGEHLDQMHKRIIKSFLSSSGKLVLDIGAGTGRFSLWLTDKGFEVVGIDLSREMLKQAKKKKKNEGKDISLVLGDLHHLPFREGVFDNCICINVVDHISDISEFLDETRYVGKIDSFLIFNISNFQSPYLPMAAVINLRKKALFKQGKIHSRWFKLQDVDNLLSKSGFSIEKIRGCMIASSLPFGDRLIKVVRLINLLVESSRLKLFSGSIFIKAQPHSNKVDEINSSQ